MAEFCLRRLGGGVGILPPVRSIRSRPLNKGLNRGFEERARCKGKLRGGFTVVVMCSLKAAQLVTKVLRVVHCT